MPGSDGGLRRSHPRRLDPALVAVIVVTAVMVLCASALAFWMYWLGAALPPATS